MPQVRKMHSATDQGPTGPGTVYSVLSGISTSLRHRALKINDTEKIKLDHQLQVLNKNSRHEKFRQSQVITRVNKRLQDKRALYKVLKDDFRANEFLTLALPHQPKDTKIDDTRYAYETRIYHGGFTQKNLQPEVDKVLHDTDPITISRFQREHRIKELKRKNEVFMVDRQNSMTSIFKAHKEHLRRRLRPETDSSERERRIKAKYDIFNEDGSNQDVRLAWQRPEPKLSESVPYNTRTRHTAINDTNRQTRSDDVNVWKSHPGTNHTVLPPINQRKLNRRVSNGIAKSDTDLDVARSKRNTSITPSKRSGTVASVYYNSKHASSKESQNLPKRTGDRQITGRKPTVVQAKPLHRQASNLALKAQVESREKNHSHHE